MDSSFLKSKLARRAFFLAVLCALIPLGALTVYYPEHFGIAFMPQISVPAEVTFVFLALLSICMALLLSIGLARRNIIALEKLRAAAHRIQRMEFDVQVDVSSDNDFEEFAESFSNMASRIEREFAVRKAIEEIDRNILASLNKEKAIATLLTQVQHVFASDTLGIYLVEDDARKYLKIFVQQDSVQVCDPIVKRALTPAEIEALRQSENGVVREMASPPPYYLKPLSELGATCFLLFPVFVRDDLAAIIAFGFSRESTYSEEDIPRARQVADQFAMALSNIALIEELEKFNWGTMKALARVVDAMSPWTAGHSERVTDLALRIGQVLNMKTEDLKSMCRGALLHDIGKIGVPSDILDKPDKLDENEKKVMRGHVEVGQHILEPIPKYADLMPIVRHHHEWFNGGGYPDGLAGEQIDLRARILAVADCFDAFTHERPYRQSLGREVAIALIWQSAGQKFDPKVVDAFLLVMSEEEKELKLGQSEAPREEIADDDAPVLEASETDLT